MRRRNYNSNETVATELIFQSTLGTQVERQKANMRLSRQGVPAPLRIRFRHRGVELRSKLGSAAAWCQRRQAHKYPIYPTTQGNRTDTTRHTTTHPNTPPSTNSPFGWDILRNANDLLTGADYASGAIGGAQIGAIRYRQSLPVSSRVIPFSKFAQGYRWMGKFGRGLGRLSYIGVPFSLGMDYYAMKQGQIGAGRFIYRITGTASSIITSIYVGAMFGGPYGAAAGLVVGFAFVGGEIAYDVVSNLIDELTQGITDMDRALTTGTWVPRF